MTPTQLEQWLLLEYGGGYKNDIRKLKGKWLTANDQFRQHSYVYMY